MNPLNSQTVHVGEHAHNVGQEGDREKDDNKCRLCFGKSIYLHGEYSQHLVDSLNGEDVQVGEHAHDVGPEDRAKTIANVVFVLVKVLTCMANIRNIWWIRSIARLSRLVSMPTM